MVYIGTSREHGQAIYLDIHAIRKVRKGIEVCGTVGDGCYEGEVLIECGSANQVTFADAWLGGAGLPDFLQRCGEGWLVETLLEEASGSLATTPDLRDNRPHVSRRRSSLASTCAETQPTWHLTA